MLRSVPLDRTQVLSGRFLQCVDTLDAARDDGDQDGDQDARHTDEGNVRDFFECPRDRKEERDECDDDGWCA